MRMTTFVDNTGIINEIPNEKFYLEKFLNENKLSLN